MLIPSLYNPSTVASQGGDVSLLISLMMLFLIGGASLAALFNPIVILVLIWGFASFRVGFAMFKGA